MKGLQAENIVQNAATHPGLHCQAHRMVFMKRSDTRENNLKTNNGIQVHVLSFAPMLCSSN